MPNNKPTFVRWRVMSILVLASFVSYTLRYNFSAAAPAMIKDLGLTEIQWGWTVAAFLTSYAFFQLPGGLLGDRFGPRRVITIIAVLWALLTALTALVPGADSASVIVIMASLMLVRILAGFAHAPIYPAGNPVVVNWFPIGGWAFPNGLSSMGLNLGIAASTPVMAWLIVEFGWRVTFLGGGMGETRQRNTAPSMRRKYNSSDAVAPWTQVPTSGRSRSVCCNC
jgi:MFS family permease